MNATAEQVSPDCTVYKMRPSGPGVEVAKLCAGGAALTELAESSKPALKTIKKKMGITIVLRIFIGGNYIKDVQ